MFWFSEKSGQTLQSRRQQQQQLQQQQQQQEANQPAAAAVVQNGDTRQVNKSYVQFVIPSFLIMQIRQFNFQFSAYKYILSYSTL